MRWAIAVGGIGVIGAVVLIFFYLVWVVFPLFVSAETRLADEWQAPDWGNATTLYLAVDEQHREFVRSAPDTEHVEPCLAQFHPKSATDRRVAVALRLLGAFRSARRGCERCWRRSRGRSGGASRRSGR